MPKVIWFWGLFHTVDSLPVNAC